jgi:lysine N6-hydroxylase
MIPPHDVVGVGIGPFNLGLAALGDGAGLRTCFLERRPAFSWHPGLLLDGARLQVPFLADLVSLVDPTSPWSFLAYLRAHDRLFPFYFAERFHIPRREYDDYCRWVADSLPSCRFGADVLSVAWEERSEAFVVEVADVATGRVERLPARNVVLGVGTAPTVPPALRGVLGDRVFHAAEYLDRRAGLLEAEDVTVVGSGQSGAEVVLDLLRARPDGRARLRWLTRSPAFAPMEYSKLGLEHFTPAYTAYFRGLPGPVRDRLVPAQWQLYKGISADTIAEIHDVLYERGIGGHWPVDVELRPCVAVDAAEGEASGVRLRCRELQQERSFEVRTDAVVLATGYAPRTPACLAPLAGDLGRDDQGRLQVSEDYRLALPEAVRGALFVQNAELHTHGVGAPDLGLGAHRSAIILNAVAGREVHRLPRRTAFTSFGAPA